MTEIFENAVGEPHRRLFCTKTFSTRDTMPLSLGIWDDESTRIWPGVYSMADLGGFEITLNPDPEALLSALTDGSIEIALLPPTTVLNNIRELDILPAVCFSSTSNPFARIQIDKIEDRTPVALSSKKEQKYYRQIAEILLKEHYGIENANQHASKPGRESNIRSAAVSDAADGDGYLLDLAREWNELVNYPLVNALFVTGRKKATSEMISIVRDTTLQIDIRKGSWIAAEQFSQEHAAFYSDHIGFRLDDLVVASLSELAEYMYYYGMSNEIPTFTLASLAESDNP